MQSVKETPKIFFLWFGRSSMSYLICVQFLLLDWVERERERDFRVSCTHPSWLLCIQIELQEFIVFIVHVQGCNKLTSKLCRLLDRVVSTCFEFRVSSIVACRRGACVFVVIGVARPLVLLIEGFFFLSKYS